MNHISIKLLKKSMSEKTKLHQQYKNFTLANRCTETQGEWHYRIKVLGSFLETTLSAKCEVPRSFKKLGGGGGRESQGLVVGSEMAWPGLSVRQLLRLALPAPLEGTVGKPSP